MNDVTLFPKEIELTIEVGPTQLWMGRRDTNDRNPTALGLTKTVNGIFGTIYGKRRLVHVSVNGAHAEFSVALRSSGKVYTYRTAMEYHVRADLEQAERLNVRSVSRKLLFKLEDTWDDLSGLCSTCRLPTTCCEPV